MMNDDMLRNIEYLREKADVSYEEASQLLEKFDGNVMRVLVELERQNRVYSQSASQGAPDDNNWREYKNHESYQKRQQEYQTAKKHASGFVSQALQYRLVVESGKGDKKRTIANISAPYVATAAVLAPWVAIPSVGLMFLMGYRAKIEKHENGPMPEDVEEFVDKTVTNIKKTASSISESFRGEKQPPKKNDDDDDDEGGEVTIE